MSVFLLWLFAITKRANHKKYFDFNSELMASSLENERLNALAISILLSKSIKNCYVTQNHEICMNAAKEFIGIIGHIPKYKDVNIHMHNADVISLARSWDDTKFGDNLSGFRYMLNDIKNNMQSLSGIEVGRCGMFIRGISPIFFENKFMGSLEVMLNFSALDDVAKKSLYIKPKYIKCKFTAKFTEI
ncbi:cache domain-containing protein [Campylobacter iguaniorum]|uniref:cache domain-containing protein n=1 Tax=Campylobacter iguaniorum TaxID=1244531 RepID=UPI0009EDB8C4|nr:cache domain-containing protein [Campylobacter iguaniorum]